jgi:Family of unknown function (DUF6869)
MEHLLGKHGAKYIDEIERLAAADPEFALLSRVWKYMMTDEVWARVEAVKARFPNTSEAREK